MINKLQSDRCSEVDALRGIAALAVVFFHFTMRRPEAELGFNLGITGVDLFFIISGFVIFMSLSKVKNSLEFIIKRVSRLYPTYWACVSFTYILITIFSIYLPANVKQVPFINYLGNMTMFQHYLKIPDLDGPYWTMIIEMNFYIGILFLFHFRMLKYLNISGITLSVMSVVLTSFFYDHSIVKKIFIWIPLLQFIPLFFAGIIFYKIYTSKNKLVEKYSILAVCLICQLLLFNNSGKSHVFIAHFEYAIMLIIYFALFILFVNGKLKFIASGRILFFGKISFALYLIHQFISLGIIIPLLTNKFHVNFWVASVLITLPVVVILATLITYYIEIPMSKRMKEKLRQTKAFTQLKHWAIKY